MKIDEWLNFFRKHKQKTVFTLADLSQLTGIKKNILSVELNRLTKSNLLQRAAKDFYENPFNPPTIEETAMVKRHPSYLSMEYALSQQGILSQRACTLTLITTKIPRIYKTKDITLEYHQISRTLFWGYKKQGIIQIAEPEKALLDLIYIRNLKNKEMKINDLKSMINDMNLEELDKNKLIEYSKKYPKNMQKILQSIGIE